MYDCGGDETPPATGFSRLTIDDTYTKQKGFGLIQPPHSDERGWRKRNKTADQKFDTFVFDSSGVTFVQDLPNGTYLVSLTSGDAQYAGSASIKLNGMQISPLRRTKSGGCVLVTSHQVVVRNGQLRVEIGGEGRLNWLTIEPSDGRKGSADPKKTVSIHKPDLTGLKPRFDYAQNLHLVPKVDVEIAQDKFGKIIRVNLHKIKDWGKVPGVKKCWPVPVWNSTKEMRGIPADCGRLAWNAVRSNIKDVDGDGRLDIFMSYGESPFGQVVRLGYDGNVIWESQRLSVATGDESGMPIADLDGDGRDECVVGHQGAIYCLDADKGKLKWKSPISSKGEVSFVVGCFQDSGKLDVVWQMGHNVVCLDCDGGRRWSYEMGGGTYGHTLRRCDVDGDGRDEIFVNVVGRTIALNADGELLWEDQTQKEHSDLLSFGDIDRDGRIEVLYDHDGCHAEKGPILIADAMTGKLEQKVDYRAIGHKHAQGVALADFRQDLPGLEFVCTSKRGGMTMWDAHGNVLWRNDASASLVSQGDWDGDGQMDVLVFALGVNIDGVFSVWNGHGKRLYALSLLPCPTVPIMVSRGIGGDYSHALPCGPNEGAAPRKDLDGNGRADILMAFGSWHFGTDQFLFLMEAP